MNRKKSHLCRVPRVSVIEIEENCDICKHVLKCVRSAKKLKLFDTLFHFQTDSCSTEKITPSFAASLIENNGALSQLKSHTSFIKCRALD